MCTECLKIVGFQNSITGECLCLIAEMTVPNVLSVLCSNDMTARQHLESQQALFHQFAKIIDFTLKFDDLKVSSHSQL